MAALDADTDEEGTERAGMRVGGEMSSVRWREGGVGGRGVRREV